MSITIADLETYAKTVPQCDCDICKSMCRAPCLATVKDAQAIVDAGYGGCLTDWNSYGLRPRKIVYRDPDLERFAKRCIFQQENGHCELHVLGLKPLEGRMTYHDFAMSKHLKISAYDLDDAFLEDWKQPEGRALWNRFHPCG